MINKSGAYTGGVSSEVSSGRVGKEQRVEKGAVKSSGNAAASGKQGVEVKLSKEGVNLDKSYQKAFEIAKQTPATRADKIKALKAQIESGEYKVDAGKVADGILLEAIKDHVSM